MRSFRRGLLPLASLVVLSLATAACSRGGATPEARLGSTDRLGSDGTSGYGRGRGAATPGSSEEFKADGGDTVYFSSDRTDLTPEAQQTLTTQVRWLARYQNHSITIEGHADERGTREYNIGLGARRAESVRDFLARNGIAPARIRVISYGKERPVAVCNDISCWSQNRRAQTVLNAQAISRN